MVKTSLVFIAIALFGLVNQSFAENRIPHPFVDKTIAGIMVGKDYEENVVRQFGKGVPVQKGYALCYSIHNKGSIIFEFGPDKVITGIIISSRSRSACRKIIPKNEQILITGKGIGLGDSPEKVIKIYGEPQKKGTKNGIVVFEYHTDFERDPQVRLFYDVYLYFQGDKLIKLVIHDGE